MRKTGLAVLLLVVACWPGMAPAADDRRGLLLLAHGAMFHHPETGEQVNIWNRNVERMAIELNEDIPTEVAFGMADPEPIQRAVDRLTGRGISDIVVIPVFVSSHSPIIGNFRYILGLQPDLAETTQLTHLERIASDARFVFGSAMDDHPLISQILLERANEHRRSPEDTTVVLIAHGPNTEQENRRWLQDLAVHAEYLREHGEFRDVKYFTHRNDAPPDVKERARKALRTAIAGADGDVIVVPVLLSAGGIEREVRNDLQGLDFHFAEPLLPHPDVRRWVEDQFHALAESVRRGGRDAVGVGSIPQNSVRNGT